MPELSDLPIPAWISTIALAFFWILTEMFRYSNRRAERLSEKRDPSWADYAEENGKLRAEVRQNHEEIDQMRLEINAMRDDFGRKLDLMGNKLDAAGRVLAQVARQNPDWRPKLDSSDIELLADTLPKNWTGESGTVQAI